VRACEGGGGLTKAKVVGGGSADEGGSDEGDGFGTTVFSSRYDDRGESQGVDGGTEAEGEGGEGGDHGAVTREQHAKERSESDHCAVRRDGLRA
jgi:hypothetical protein